MKSKTLHWTSARLLLTLTLLLFAASSVVLAQTPVDDNGEPLGPVYSDADDDGLADTDISLLTANELATLIGPVALYPDDLLAVVLPASTYPLEVVQASRYLEQLKTDSSLQPDDAWDDSVVALLNYPEVLTMMSEDIDWTWRLGEAVIAQQADVIAAVESFRDRAYVAGNLKSDKRQTVSRNEEDVIEIQPVADDVIYVPYYEPERVVVYQRRPVYHYYPRAYPVYYYPYPAGYYFADNFFWGVTTAYRIGWYSDHLHVYHHSYRGHPYYGWNYYGSYWRRPSIQIFNTWYGGYGYANVHDRYRYGSYWRPRRHGGARPGFHSNRDRYYRDRRRSTSEDRYANRNQRDRQRGNSPNATSALVPRSNDAASTGRRAINSRSGGAAGRAASRRNDNANNDDSRRNIRFRNRNSSADGVNAQRRDTGAARNNGQRRAAATPNRSEIAGARTTDARRRSDAASTRRRTDAAPRAAEARSNPQPRLTNGAAAQRRIAQTRPRTNNAANRAAPPRRAEVERTPSTTRQRSAPPAAARRSAPPRAAPSRPAAQRPAAAAEPARRSSRSSSRRRD